MTNKKHLCIVLCLLSAFMLGILIGCSSAKTDPFNYVSVNYSGYDGNGTAYVSFDKDSLIETVIGQEPKEYEEWGEWFSAYDEFSSNISVTCTPNKNLSNGDTVAVVVTVSGEAEKKIASGEKTFQVSGLPEIQTIDFFKDIEITYDGIVGGLTSVQLNKLSKDETLQSCNFHIEPLNNIKNGDTITVTITNTDALAEQYLCVPKETVKTFTVSGLDEYLSDPNLLSEEQLCDIISLYLPDSAEEDNFIFSYSDPEYYKTYFCVGNKNRIGADFNRLEIFVCYQKYMKGEPHSTIYKPLTFRDIVVSADGAIDLKYENGISVVFYTDPDRMVAKMEEDYTVKEVYVEYEETIQAPSEPESETVYVIQSVNVRNGPGTEYEKIGSLSFGESIQRIAARDDGWSEIIYQGEIAYVSSDYLSEKMPQKDSSINSSSNSDGEDNTTNPTESDSSSLTQEGKDTLANLGITEEQQKEWIEEAQTCRHCGGQNGPYHRWIADVTCPRCGAHVPANTCHYC